MTFHGAKMKLDFEANMDFNAFKDGKSRVAKFDITEGKWVKNVRFFESYIEAVSFCCD